MPAVGRRVKWLAGPAGSTDGGAGPSHRQVCPRKAKPAQLRRGRRGIAVAAASVTRLAFPPARRNIFLAEEGCCGVLPCMAPGMQTGERHYLKDGSFTPQRLDRSAKIYTGVASCSRALARSDGGGGGGLFREDWSLQKRGERDGALGRGAGSGVASGACNLGRVVCEAGNVVWRGFWC